MLIVIIIFAINILWAVHNWKKEFEHMKFVWSHPKQHTVYDYITSFTGFAGDLIVTGTATSIFGFAGFYGSAMAIFMSNVLSMVFFVPKKNKSKGRVAYA